MFIEIKQGTYGYVKPGTNSVDPKDPTSGAFEVPEPEAKRLIGMGVAVKAGDSGGIANDENAESGNSDEGGAGNSGDTAKGSRVGTAFTLSALERVNKDAQIKLAERRGVDLSTATNGRGRAKLIWDDIQSKKGGYVPQTIEEVEHLVDDDAQPPDLAAGGPVV